MRYHGNWSKLARKSYIYELKINLKGELWLEDWVQNRSCFNNLSIKHPQYDTLRDDHLECHGSPLKLIQTRRLHGSKLKNCRMVGPTKCVVRDHTYCLALPFYSRPYLFCQTFQNITHQISNFISVSLLIKNFPIWCNVNFFSCFHCNKQYKNNRGYIFEKNFNT